MRSIMIWSERAPGSGRGGAAGRSGAGPYRRGGGVSVRGSGRRRRGKRVGTLYHNARAPREIILCCVLWSHPPLEMEGGGMSGEKVERVARRERRDGVGVWRYEGFGGCGGRGVWG